jgi:hypothetical protein
MKPCEFTILVTTDGPIDKGPLLIAIKDVDGVTSAEVIRFRVVPTPKKVKA